MDSLLFGIVGDVHISDNPPSTRKDDYRAAVLNVKQSVRIIESSLEIQKDEEKGLKVIGAIYRIAL